MVTTMMVTSSEYNYSTIHMQNDVGSSLGLHFTYYLICKRRAWLTDQDPNVPHRLRRGSKSVNWTCKRGKPQLPLSCPQIFWIGIVLRLHRTAVVQCPRLSCALRAARLAGDASVSDSSEECRAL